MARKSRFQTRSAGCVQDMGYRTLEVRASTFDANARTVEATVSTETPVPMPDYGRMEMVSEVLLSSGVEWPRSKQVPFLDSHNRSSVKDQLGSARGLRIVDNAVTATLHFSGAGHAEEALSGVRDGHITDVSAGYQVLKRVYVPRNESKVIAGRTFEGPVNVVTKWRLQEVSLTPIGADAQAKLRGLDPNAVRFQSDEEKDFQMNPELRKFLVGRGMPESLSDDEAQRWLLDNPGKLSDPPKAEERKAEQPAFDAEAMKRAIAEAVAIATQQEQEKRAAFEKSVKDLCGIAELPEEFENCRNLADEAAVKAHLTKVKADRAAQIPYGGMVRFIGSGFDRLTADIRSALTLKAVRSAANGSDKLIEKYVPADQRTNAVEQFRHATLLDLATEFVRALGVQTLGLTREEIAISAMFGPEKAGVRSHRDAPYHTTGSFANLTLDAINKSMQVGYTEYPATWRGPMRQGESVADFKTINRIRLGGVPNLPIWNDVENPNRVSMADAKESYAVECRSYGIDFSYKLIVNDDMAALTRVPMSLGDAASRTVNALAWSQITSNPTMSDGQALFSAATGNRKQKNLETGAISNYTTALNTLTANMMVMRGENSPEQDQGADVLGLMPRHIAFPAALRGTILQLLGSEWDPGAGLANIRNINTGLLPVMEPLLDSSSTTAIYLFADTSRIDTVEVTFLQGQETPQIRSVMDEHKLAMTYYVLQTVGAKPLNHRGMQKHAGA